MNKQIIIMAIFAITVLISGVLIFFNNSNQNNFDENNENNNFYNSGINLTFENINSKFDEIKPLTHGVCEYDFGNGIYLEAQCNILVVRSPFLDFGEGRVNEDIYKKEVNNLIDKIKKHNTRIIGTINTLSTIIIELQNDKNIAVIKEDFGKSDYFEVSYNSVVLPESD